jgi:hypothetical protein
MKSHANSVLKTKRAPVKPPSQASGLPRLAAPGKLTVPGCSDGCGTEHDKTSAAGSARCNKVYSWPQHRCRIRPFIGSCLVQHHPFGNWKNSGGVASKPSVSDTGSPERRQNQRELNSSARHHLHRMATSTSTSASRKNGRARTYLHVLDIFNDLVMHGRMPPPDPGPAPTTDEPA